MKLAYGYGRGSTEEQEITLDQQEFTCRAYFDYRLKPQGFTWGGMFLDPGVSGGKPFLEREAGIKLDSRLTTGDAVIFAKLDRGFRICADACITVDAWHRRGVQVHILDINVDTTTESGMFVMQVMAAFAQMERRRISQRMLDMHVALRRQGRPSNGDKPWGMKIIRVGPKREKRLVVDEEERERMRQVVRWRDEDALPWKQIVTLATRLWVRRGPLHTGGRRWSQGMVMAAYKYGKNLPPAEETTVENCVASQ